MKVKYFNVYLIIKNIEQIIRPIVPIILKKKQNKSSG